MKKKNELMEEVELGRKYKRKCSLLLSLSYKASSREILSNVDRTRYDSLLYYLSYNTRRDNIEIIKCWVE